MIHSMPGYGKAVGEIKNKKVIIEIKTLNSKQLDVSVRMPNLYRDKELEIRSLITQKLERGKIDFSLNIENFGKENSSKINQPIIKAYYEQLQELSRETGIPVTQDWLSVLMRLPDTLKTEIEELDEDEWNEIVLLIDNALTQVLEFREQEGKALESALTQNINRIGELLVEIEPYENERIEKYELGKLPDRVEDPAVWVITE